MTGRRPHRGVLKIARAALGTLLAGVALPVMLLFGLLLIPLGDLLSGRRRLGYEIGRSIMGVCWLLLGIRIEEVHRERIEPFRTRVYMPNHESLLDMPAVLSLLPGANGTLIKAEAYRVPLVGQAFRAVGFTPVDRKSPVSARRSLLSPMGTRVRSCPTWTGVFEVSPYPISKPGKKPKNWSNTLISHRWDCVAPPATAWS